MSYDVVPSYLLVEMQLLLSHSRAYSVAPSTYSLFKMKTSFYSPRYIVQYFLYTFVFIVPLSSASSQTIKVEWRVAKIILPTICELPNPALTEIIMEEHCRISAKTEGIKWTMEVRWLNISRDQGYKVSIRQPNTNADFHESVGSMWQV